VAINNCIILENGIGAWCCRRKSSPSRLNLQCKQSVSLKNSSESFLSQLANLHKLTRVYSTFTGQKTAWNIWRHLHDTIWIGWQFYLNNTMNLRHFNSSHYTIYTHKMAIVSWPYIPWRHFTLCTGYFAQCTPDCPCCRLFYMAYVDFIIGRNRRPVRANSRRYADELLSATAIKQPHTKRAINFRRQLQCVNYYNTMGCNVGSVRRPCGAECAFTKWTTRRTVTIAQPCC